MKTHTDYRVVFHGVEHPDYFQGHGVAFTRFVVMVGDDKRHTVDKDDCTPIEREDYCGECGQIGCSHDGYDRSEA